MYSLLNSPSSSIRHHNQGLNKNKGIFSLESPCGVIPDSFINSLSQKLELQEQSQNGCHRIAWGEAGSFIEKKNCELRKHGKEERCQVYGVIKAEQVKKGWCDFCLWYWSCLLVWMKLVLIFPPKESSFKTSAQVPFQINNIGISIGSTRALLLFCSHSLDDSLGWNISQIL